jgi:hypothetical protein
MNSDATAKVPAARSRLFRFSVQRFLVSLVSLLVVTPFVEDLKHGETLETAIATMVLLTGLFAAGGQPRSMIWALIFVVPAVVGNWTNHFWPARYPLELVFIARTLFLAFLMGHLMRFILHARKVNSEVVCGALSVYLLLGLIWGITYRLVGRLTPDAFNFSVPNTASHSMNPFEAIYFSYTTLTTVGYGDITPVSKVARMLAITEALTGTLFMAVLVARLVSLYSAPDLSGVAEESKKNSGTE